MITAAHSPIDTVEKRYQLWRGAVIDYSVIVCLHLDAEPQYPVGSGDSSRPAEEPVMYSQAHDQSSIVDMTFPVAVGPKISTAFDSSQASTPPGCHVRAVLRH